MIEVFRAEPLSLSLAGINESDLIESVHNLRNYTAVKKSQLCVIPVDLDLRLKTKDDLEKLFRQTDVSLVVNLAGPFFSSSLGSGGILPHHERLIQACVSSNVHYVDIAESTDHVKELLAKEDAWFEGGESGKQRSSSLVITGASTVPALSTACAADALADLHPDAGKGPINIEVFLSPGNKVKQRKIGFAAVASLFLRLGKTFSTIRGGSVVARSNWTNLRKEVLLPPVGPRLACEVESPDVMALLQKPPNDGEKPFVENYSFHAGLERPTVTRCFSLLGAVAARLPLVAPILRHRMLSVLVWHATYVFRRFLGSSNGSFMVRVQRNGFGSCVTFVAQKGDGVYLPIIPIMHVVDKLFVNKPATMRPGGVLVCATQVGRGISHEYAPTVADTVKFASMLKLSVATFRIASVFSLALGNKDFKSLHPDIQAFHSRQSPRNFSTGLLEPIVVAGTFTAAAVRNPLLALAGWFMGLPRGVDKPTGFSLHSTLAPLEEVWERRFPSGSGGNSFTKMVSKLRVKPSMGNDSGFQLEETFLFGLIKFHFVMRAVDPQQLQDLAPDHPVKAQGDGRVLVFDFFDLRVAGILIPKFLEPKIHAFEYAAPERKGLVYFDVKAVAPLGLGIICHYKGSVQVMSAK